VEVLVFLLLAAAVRGLVHQTREDLARWRGRPARAGRAAGRRVTTRAAGYWLNQLAHGFPSVRHGFMDGWARGMQAHHEARRAIAEHLAKHAERRAGLEPELTDLRARRRQALEEINRRRALDRDHAEAERENQARDARRQAVTDRDYDEASTEDAARAPAEAGAQPRPEPPTCGHSGEPCRPGGCLCACAGCDEARAAACLPESKPAGEKKQERPPPDPEDDLDDQPYVPAGASSEGDGTVSETTVSGVEARMNAAITAAETRQAEAGQSRAYTE
jgi:hypothetical protein